MKFNQQPEQNQNNEKSPRLSRREFLKGVGVIGGAAALSSVGTLTVVTNMEHEAEMNKLHTFYEGQEMSYGYAQCAVDDLLAEMNKKEIHSIKTTGDGLSDDKITFLRDFITSHMTSKAASPYSDDYKNEFQKGFYTKNLLQNIKREAMRFQK